MSYEKTIMPKEFEIQGDVKSGLWCEFLDCELDIAYDWYKNDRIKNSIFDHVSENIKSMVVIGGEPTIIKEFYEL